MRGKTVVVTGGSSGIGKATATILAGMGARVIVTARDRARGEAALADIGGDSEVRELDLASLASVRAFARGLDGPVDVLVNNAGSTARTRQVTEDGFERLFQVNYLAPFLLTRLLADRIRGRIVNVASSSHRTARPLDFDDLQHERGPYVGLAVYARTKLAVVLWTRELARRLPGIAVNAVHPGTVRTGWGLHGDAGRLLTLGLWTARWFFLSPMQAGRRVAYVAADPAVEGRTGGYYVRRSEVAPSRAAQDDEAARRLWEVTEDLIRSLPEE